MTAMRMDLDRLSRRGTICCVYAVVEWANMLILRRLPLSFSHLTCAAVVSNILA
jgi:hypothetical protein